MSKRKEEEQEVEVETHFEHDDFMRNFKFSVHSNKPLRPEHFLDELEKLLYDYRENPEELFDFSSELHFN